MDREGIVISSRNQLILKIFENRGINKLESKTISMEKYGYNSTPEFREVITERGDELFNS